jgi:integrase
MTRRALTAQQVAAIKGIGKYRLAPNLILQITENGADSYIFRYRKDGQEHHYGLGARADVTYRKARERAEELRIHVRKGGHPVEERRAERAAVKAARQAKDAKPVPTFEEMAKEYIEAHRVKWTNPKHEGQWSSTLKTYVYPAIGKMAVGDITTDDILRVLKPIWTKKLQTAKRTRGRIEAVLGYAKALKHRTGDNPAAWKDNLEHLLPAPNKVHQIQPHRAMPHKDVPAFMANLLSTERLGVEALRFTILNGMRSSEVLGARWDEVDMTERVWTVPKTRMKARKEFRVPLSDHAIAVLEMMKARKLPGPYIFPGIRRGRPIAGGVMLRILRTLRPDVVLDVHGFRSTLRDWCAERTDFPREVAEACLAHEVGNEVERAYRRTDFLEKRRALMQAWAEFVMSGVDNLAMAGIGD